MGTSSSVVSPVLLVVLCSAWGCSDYRFDKVEPVIPTPTFPVLEVDPSAIEGGAACGEQSHAVTLSNVGDALLNITDLEVEGEGWTLALAPSLPASIAPDDVLVVELVGGGGPAALVVRSDDLDRPEVRVAVESEVDLPPAISLDVVGDGGVLSIGAVETLVATVSDELAEGMTVSWSTDLEGVFATSEADEDGVATTGWVSRDRLAGAQVLTVTVTDGCENTASDSIPLCQAEGYVADELDLGDWHFEGTAEWDASREVVELTSLDPFAVGTAFHTAQAVGGDAVVIRFDFETGGGTGADGLSLTALDVDRMTGFMGAPGCALGYGEAHESCIEEGEALPGWSLEIDTYYNPTIDPSSSNHMSLTFDGDLDAWAVWTDLEDVEDTGWHTLEVVVAAPDITVTLDGDVIIDASVVGFVPFDAFVGFTAATGADTNRHGIRGLEVTGDTCEDWVPL